MKFLILTNAAGATGLVAAVIADETLKDDEVHEYRWPGVLPGDQELIVWTCKSRAGNKELWKRWAEEVKRVVVATRERLTRANLLQEYSKRIVLTMDGENGQLKQFEEQTTFASYLEELIVLIKLASATSLVAQANDLSKMHSMIHKGCKTQADLDSDVTEYVRKQFDSVVVKQVFASRPSRTIVTQLGKIFSAFASRAFEFLDPKVVRAGHIKAGWGRLDGQVDWDIMIRRYSFQLNQDDAARLKGTVAPVLQKEIWTNSQISEEVFDDNQVPRSAKEEKDFEGKRLPRDQRTTSERRAVIMLTKEAQAARKKEVETREAHFESKKKQNIMRRSTRKRSRNKKKKNANKKQPVQLKWRKRIMR